MHLKSRVRKLKSELNGLIAPLPRGIIAYLELQHGDKIEWRMERMGDQRVVIVSKI